MKYLLGVVHGFQLINFQWVLDCVSLRSKLPLQNYLLPIGFSKVDNRMVEPNDKALNLRNLFVDGKNKKLHVLVAAIDKHFIADWKPVLVSCNR